MFETIKNGMKKVSIPCPDGIQGCLVAHFKWIPIEEVKSETDEKQMNRIKERWVSHGILYQDDGDWIIEKAERAKKLENLIKSHAPEGRNYSNAQYVELLQENRQLYEALEFYADKKTYQLGVSISMGSAFPQHEPIKYDKGEKARQAIEQED